MFQFFQVSMTFENMGNNQNIKKSFTFYVSNINTSMSAMKTFTLDLFNKVYADFKRSVQ